MKPVVILGVTGSVAAYRACDVARDLMRSGMEVRACLSRSAVQFVTPALFEGLTGQPVLTDVFDEPVCGRMAHIDWARQAKALLVCPATANAIAVLARGESNDMFTTIALATRAQLVVAPAMNPDMFASSATQDNLAVLRARGAIVVEPGEGAVACGEQGQGKLAATDEIVAATLSAVFRSRLLQGVRIVITAGPTQEPIDAVRYISNRSSGRMGYELARAAIQMGANVTLISGPTALSAPPWVELARVATVLQMLNAALAACDGAHVLIGAAAVADFRVESPPTGKIKRDRSMQLELVESPDILMEAGGKYADLKIVGFAAETDDHLENAIKKLQAKKLFAIAVNDVSRADIGFDSAENELTVLFADGSRVKIPKASKFNVAVALLEALATRLDKSQ